MERKTAWGRGWEETFLENGGQREPWREHGTRHPNWPPGLSEPVRALPRTSVCADKCADMHSTHMDTRTHAQTHTDSSCVHTDIHKHTHTNTPTTHTQRHMTNAQTSPMCAHAPPSPLAPIQPIPHFRPSQVTCLVCAHCHDLCDLFLLPFTGRHSLSQPGGVLGFSLTGPR